MGRIVSLTTGQLSGVHCIILLMLKSRVGSAEYMKPCHCQEVNHEFSVQPEAQFALPTVLYRRQTVLCVCDIFYTVCRLYNCNFSVIERKLEMTVKEWMRKIH
jgi:hypothetical protein